MAKRTNLIDTSPYPPMFDFPCMFYNGGAATAECDGCEYRASDLEAENSKLRCLCRDLFDRLNDKDKYCGECRSCEYDAWNFGDEKCVYTKRMRELGIEVE